MLYISTVQQERMLAFSRDVMENKRINCEYLLRAALYSDDVSLFHTVHA